MKCVLFVPLLAVALWILLLVTVKVPHSSVKYENWTAVIDFGSMCCFYANFLKHLLLSLSSSTSDTKKNLFIVHMTVATINMMAGTSNLLRYIGWGALCEDILGFGLPLTMWIEWLVCVPTMGFIATFTDEHHKIYDRDKFFIASLGICILLGFGATFVRTIWAYILLLSGSFLAFFASASIVLSQSFRPGYQIVDGANIDIEPSDFDSITELRQFLNRSTKTKKLNRLLIYVLPPFPILFMLGAVHVLSREWAYVGLCLANFLAKYMFLTNASELHMDLVERLVAQLNTERTMNAARLNTERAINESRRVYLRYVFHEVRVPLNSLSLGLNVMMEKDGFTDDERDALLMMRDSTTFMADTLNDVLSMNQIEEGKMSLKFERMSVREMLQRALSALKGAAVGKGIELLLKVDVSVPGEVMADKFRLEHVVANLVSNAVKFSPLGSKVEVKVTMEATASVNDNGALGAGADVDDAESVGPCMAHLNISVKDEGHGLSADDINNLFTPFQQIRPDAVQQRNGTGLGLSLARSIVRLHGGKLTCESQLGHGCTFIIRLPLEICDDVEATSCEPMASTNWAEDDSAAEVLAPSAVPDQHSLSAPAPASASASASVQRSHTTYNGAAAAAALPTQRIQALVVDDTLSNRKMLAMVLSMKNIKCSFAEDGLKGVEAVRDNPGLFDIIFMDNTMPVMTGVEATRVLRSEGFANLVIAVTGNALDDDVEVFLSAGADLVLAKPMQSAHLQALLTHIAVYGCGSSGHKLKIVDNVIQLADTPL